MESIFNVYCDESCHLENSQHNAMVLGSIWCPIEKTREISEQIRGIKEKHNLNIRYEAKWNKISKSKIDFYNNLIDYFFENDNLHFRGLVIPDKSKLNHKAFNQSHDDWYYKMYFDLLKTVFSPQQKYRIYVDIKDTRGGEKIEKLHEVLCNNMLDFDRKTIEKIQLIRSHESEVIQLVDLLIGALSYINRGSDTSGTKLEIIKRIKSRSGYSLVKTTLFREEKFNLLVWNAQEAVL